MSEVILHKYFTFAKLWTAKNKADLRRHELQTVRKTMGHGNGIGMCPKDGLSKAYIELETKLFEFDRCCTLNTKRLKWNPSNSQGWIDSAEREQGLGDHELARAIFEPTLDPRHDQLDNPEILWKAYIDLKVEDWEYDRARSLYEPLLSGTNHAKVWISFVKLVINVSEKNKNDAEDRAEDYDENLSAETETGTRSLFIRRLQTLKEQGLTEDCITLLDAWEGLERLILRQRKFLM